MYQVTLLYNDENSLSYYYSYAKSDDTKLGNIVCKELPPYQDIDMARACYWDFDNEVWVFDPEMYEKILKKNAKEASEAEQRRLEEEARPTIDDLMIAIMELASGQSDLEDAITELASIVMDQEVTING